jgi:hypothetical protein
MLCQFVQQVIRHFNSHAVDDAEPDHVGELLQVRRRRGARRHRDDDAGEVIPTAIICPASELVVKLVEFGE